MRDIQIYHPYDKCSEHEKSRFFKENYRIIKKYKYFYLCEKLDENDNVLYRECFSIFDIDGVPKRKIVSPFAVCSKGKWSYL